ncbi:MAG: hypothetical protein H6Q73_2611 [Firmicutes bacterium]|nr:hypothetical protein [Bacillota bacterium]
MQPNLLEIAGHIADMKDVNYKNTLAIVAIIELLIEKGLMSKDEFASKAREMEQASLAEILLSRRASILERKR